MLLILRAHTLAIEYSNGAREKVTPVRVSQPHVPNKPYLGIQAPVYTTLELTIIIVMNVRTVW